MSDGRVISETHSEAETVALGRRLGGLLGSGDVLGLAGPLGAGKTRLVKGIVAGLGMKDTRRVASPTYVIVKEYAARLHVYHVDAYRLGGADELLDIGFAEMCDAGGVVLVEWADRVSAALPADHLRITIEPVPPAGHAASAGENERRIYFEAFGEASATLLRRFENL